MRHDDDLTVICPSCGAGNPADRALCQQCGDRLASTSSDAKARAFRAAKERGAAPDPPPLAPEQAQPDHQTPSNIHVCPVCGTPVVGDLTPCGHCGYGFGGSSQGIDLARSPASKSAIASQKRWTISFSTVLLATGLIAVVLGIFRTRPWLVVPLGFVGLLALLVTLGAVQRRAREFRPMSFEEKLLKFVWSGFWILLLIVGVGAAVVASIVIALMLVCGIKPF